MNETDALKRLSEWLKGYGWKVLQDKKNTNNNPLFHVTGESTKKPDIIGTSLKGYTIALEVKSGEHGKDLGNYSKLMNYFENYNNRKTLYYDEKEIHLKINDFVIATYYSPEGRLEHFEQKHISSERHTNASNNNFYGLRFCPKTEYETTFNLIRRGIWDHVKHEDNRLYETGIGALLSNILDDENDSPAIFVKKPNKYNQTWGTRWLKQI